MKSILYSQTTASEAPNAASRVQDSFPFQNVPSVRWTRLFDALARAAGWFRDLTLTPRCPQVYLAAPPLACTCNTAQAAPPYDFLLVVPSARHVGLWERWGGYPGNPARRPLSSI